MENKTKSFKTIILMAIISFAIILFVGSCSNTYIFLYSSTYDVVDETTDKQVQTKELKLYYIDEYKSTIYVDVEDFASLLEGTVSEVTKSDGRGLSFIYSNRVFSDLQSNIVIAFNARNSCVTYSDFNFNTYINLYALKSNSANIDFNVSYDDIVPIKKVINLSDYEINIMKQDNHYYIPLQVASLLLGGEYVKVYLKDNDVYITDNLGTSDFLGVSENDSIGNNSDLVSDTVNFMALFFDNFYGLKNYSDVTSYIDVFTDYGFYDAKSIEELDYEFEQFIIHNDDLHTSIIDYGYYQNEIKTVTPNLNSKISDFYNTIDNDSCLFKNNDINLLTYDNYYVLEINRFNTDLNRKLNALLVNINQDQPIYIDLSCNPGGNIIGVFSLLSYMTDDSVNLYLKNAASDIRFSYRVDMDQTKALTNDFYIFTSKVTYSAANLFVSIIKDNDLGLVFGNRTSGGTASPAFVVFPNDMVMSYSTNFVFTDRHHFPIESGINPDMFVFSNSIDDAIIELNTKL